VGHSRTIWRSDITIVQPDIPRNVLAGIPCILPDVSQLQSYLACGWIWRDVPELFSDIAVVLSCFTVLLSHVAKLCSNESSVLADVTSNVTNEPESGWIWRDLAIVFSHVTSVQPDFSKRLQRLAGLLANLACILPHESRIQPYVSRWCLLSRVAAI
jgi:hypothetical protein